MEGHSFGFYYLGPKLLHIVFTRDDPCGLTELILYLIFESPMVIMLGRVELWDGGLVGTYLGVEDGQMTGMHRK